MWWYQSTKTANLAENAIKSILASTSREYTCTVDLHYKNIKTFAVIVTIPIPCFRDVISAHLVITFPFTGLTYNVQFFCIFIYSFF